MSTNPPQRSADFIYNFVLVGKFGVGKTTLMKTAALHASEAGPAANKEEKNDRTNEVATAAYGVDYRILQTEVDRSTVDIKICDTGGIERYRHDLTSNYYDFAHVALLVYDITDETSLQSLKDVWLPDAKKYCPWQCLKVVVANKMDRIADRACDKAKVKKWAEENDLRYEEVSALKKDSVDKLFTRLAQHLLGGSSPPDVCECCGIC